MTGFCELIESVEMVVDRDCCASLIFKFLWKNQKLHTQIINTIYKHHCALVSNLNTANFERRNILHLMLLEYDLRKWHSFFKCSNPKLISIFIKKTPHKFKREMKRFVNDLKHFQKNIKHLV